MCTVNVSLYTPPPSHTHTHTHPGFVCGGVTDAVCYQSSCKVFLSGCPGSWTDISSGGTDTDCTWHREHTHTRTHPPTHTHIKGFGSRVETVRQPITGSMAAVTCPVTHTVISAGHPPISPYPSSPHCLFLPPLQQSAASSIKELLPLSFPRPCPSLLLSPLLAVWFFCSNEPGGSQGSLC